MSKLDLETSASPTPKQTDLIASESNSISPLTLQSISREDASLLARSVILEETDPPGAIRTAIIIISAFVVVFLVWAAFTEFDEKSVAEGEIVPLLQIQQVQHLEGGIIGAIRVSEGETVTEGQTLLQMDDTAIRAERDALAARVAALGLQAERLRAFAAESAPNFDQWKNTYSEMTANQQSAYDTAVKNRAARIRGLNAQITARREEINGLKARADSLVLQAASTQEKLDMNNELLAKGLTSKVVNLDIKTTLARISGDLAQTQADISRADATLAEAISRKAELIFEMSQSALVELSQTDGELGAQTERLKRLNDQLARTRVRAPIAGKISGMLFNRPGIVVKPGDIMLSVVPQQNDLVADVRIPASDIGHIIVGASALVKVDSYKFGRVGGVNGTVTRISATSFEDKEGERFFRARVKLDSNFIGSDPSNNRIVPGMTVVADIKTGQKSLLAYLLRPITVSLDQAFAER